MAQPLNATKHSSDHTQDMVRCAANFQPGEGSKTLLFIQLSGYSLRPLSHCGLMVHIHKKKQP